TRWRRRSLPPLPKTEETPETVANRAIMRPFVVLGGLMGLLMMFVVAIPWLPHSPSFLLWRRYIVYGIMGVGLVTLLSIPLMTYRTARRLQTVLTEGPWWEMTMGLAARAGVRVKRVVQVKSAACNAFASPLGTVGLTTALLEKLEPEEIRAIIAHELGHLKGG